MHCLPQDTPGIAHDSPGTLFPVPNDKHVAAVYATIDDNVLILTTDTPGMRDRKLFSTTTLRGNAAEGI